MADDSHVVIVQKLLYVKHTVCGSIVIVRQSNFFITTSGVSPPHIFTQLLQNITAELTSAVWSAGTNSWYTIPLMSQESDHYALDTAFWLPGLSSWWPWMTAALFLGITINPALISSTGQASFILWSELKLSADINMLLYLDSHGGPEKKSGCNAKRAHFSVTIF